VDSGVVATSLRADVDEPSASVAAYGKTAWPLTIGGILAVDNVQVSSIAAANIGNEGALISVAFVQLECVALS
jgi:hypothetical protein